MGAIFSTPSETCSCYCCSSFATFNEEYITGASDLQNPVHPIFGRGKFPHNSDEDYEWLKPSCRLASLLLESDVALPFILRVFDGRLQAGDGETISLAQLHAEETNFARGPKDVVAPWDYHLVSRPDQTEPTSQNKQRVSQLLTALTGMVEFDVRPPREVDELRPGEGAVAMERHGCLTQSMLQNFPLGSQSYVLVRSEPLEKLKQSLEWETKYPPSSPKKSYFTTPFFRFVTAWEIAEDLLHELAHCQWIASCGPAKEKSHTHGTMPEGGFEFISQIFGGIPHAQRCHLDLPRPVRSKAKKCNRGKPMINSPVACLEPWPNGGLLKGYLPCWLQRSQFLKPRMAIRETVTRIPLTYFKDLFSTEFWARVHAEGPDAIKPPTVGSWSFNWMWWKGNKESDRKGWYTRCRTATGDIPPMEEAFGAGEGANPKTDEQRDADAVEELAIQRPKKRKRSSSQENMSVDEIMSQGLRSHRLVNEENFLWAWAPCALRGHSDRV